MKTLGLNMTLAALIALSCSLSLPAAEINGVNFADQIKLGPKTLALNGMGLRQATIFHVNVYAGALYLETQSHDADSIINSAGLKRVEMAFMRDVGADKISEAWAEGFDKNCVDACDTMKPAIARLQSLTKDMKKGDIMAFNILPDRVEVSVRDAKAGTLEGKDFGRNLLRLWLGRNPPNAGLKAGFLGVKD